MNPAPVDPQTVLLRTPCFQGIEPALMAELVQAARTVTYRKGEVVTHLGQCFHHLAVIAAGEIELSVTNRAGKRHVLNVMRAGQLYGLIPMLDGEPLYYGATATSPCTMVTLSREVMLDAMHRSSALMMAIFKVMCKRSRETFSAMADQHLLSPTARLARHLITLASTYGVAENVANGVLSVEFSQAELSEMLGISRQSLNHEMKLLEAQGLVQKGYSRIVLPDIGKLRELVNHEL